MVTADHPPIACARSSRELNDGLAEYNQWNHGYAFPGSHPICVHFRNIPACGPLREDAQLCTADDNNVATPLPLKVKDRYRSGLSLDTLGQLEQPDDCQTDFGITVMLDRPWPILAVRAWYRDMTPRVFAVHVESAPGQWQAVFETKENGLRAGLRASVADPVHNIPITAEFSPTMTRGVRLTVRCVPDQPFDPSRSGRPVWLTEVEVFARLTRLQAWQRYVFQR
jgi:hypothetical protein